MRENFAQMSVYTKDWDECENHLDLFTLYQTFICQESSSNYH